MSSPHDHAAQVSTVDLEPTLARFQRPWRLGQLPCALRFPTDLERAFEAETGEARVRELRFAISLGLITCYVTTVLDLLFVPDLGLGGILIRLLATPLAVFIGIFARKLSAATRELTLTVSATLAIALLAIIPVVSTAATSPYAFSTIFVMMVFANTAVPLRFDRSRYFTILSCAACFLAAWWSSSLTFGTAAGIDLQTLLISFVSLMANYRIERGARLSYLLAGREAHRLAVISKLSITDPLTGLANRRHFESVAAALFAAPENAGLSVGLLMIDVDCFKRYNDHYGHASGDVCLRAIAEALTGVLRGTADLAVRLGGEEFVVLLPDVDLRQANVIAQWLRGAVAARELDHANRDDGSTMVTVSIGVAHCTLGDGTAVADLLETADQALYAAKRLGRNRVEVQRSVAPGIAIRDAADVLRSLGSDASESPNVRRGGNSRARA